MRMHCGWSFDPKIARTVINAVVETCWHTFDGLCHRAIFVCGCLVHKAGSSQSAPPIQSALNTGILHSAFILPIVFPNRRRVRLFPCIKAWVKWTVLVGYFRFFARSNRARNGAARTLSTVYQQDSTTRASVGNRAEVTSLCLELLTKLLVLPFLPVNVVSFLLCRFARFVFFCEV